ISDHCRRRQSFYGSSCTIFGHA
ncbi:biotin-requiring enzyme family protein, partial [Vibrio parahaemolyticus 50]